jgi:hypothetical protein
MLDWKCNFFENQEVTKYFIVINRRHLLLTGSSVLVGCGKSKPYAQVMDDQSILTIGDQYTTGSGNSTQFSYPNVISRYADVKVDSISENLATFDVGLQKLIAYDLSNTALCIIMMGANNFLRQDDPKVMERYFKRMVETLYFKGIPIIIVGVGMPKSGKNHPMYQKMATEYSTMYIETWFHDIFANKEWLADELSWNVLGHREFGMRMIKYLKPLGFLG